MKKMSRRPLSPSGKTHENLRSNNFPSVKGWQKTKFSDGVVVVGVAVKRPPRPLRVHPSEGWE